MAYVLESAGMGKQSGVIGDMVLVQTEGGTIARARPRGSRRRSEGQIAQGRRIELAGWAWQDLSMEEAQAWRTYALEQAAALPVGSRKRLASARSLFSGLGSKYLQIHGGREMPRLPPTGRFLGDAIGVTVSAEGRLLGFVADASNREGVRTEILAQSLTCPHNMARPKSYVSLGFASMEAGVPVVRDPGYGASWACAVKFVEASTGRQTGLIEIGRATVGAAS